MNPESSHFITLLEGRLKAAVEVSPQAGDDEWLLLLHLVYDGEPCGTASFSLHGYTRAEAEQLAANPAQNAFLMKEIDEFLWGESD